MKIRYGRDEAVGIDKLMSLADEGDAEAQCVLGMHYIYSLQLEWNPKKGMKLLETAANQGLLTAQHQIGLMYLSNDARSKNKKKGMEWLKIAADRGFSKAQSTLGQYLIYQSKILEDKQKAIEWLLKAANQQDSHAYYFLGIIYWKDPELYNPIESIKWFEKGAKVGHAAATDLYERRAILFGDERSGNFCRVLAHKLK